MKLRSLSPFLFVTLLVTFLSSCEHKELCYDHPHVGKLELYFDWRDAPEADPKSMRVYFYDLDTNNAPIVYSIPGKTGGIISVPNGRYSVVAYNDDTESILYGNYANFDSHRIYTRESGLVEPAGLNTQTANIPRPQSTLDEAVVATPDQVWGCAQEVVTVDVHEREIQVITLFPHIYTCHYTYEIRNITDISGVATLSAALTGMAGYMNVADEELPIDAYTLPLEAKFNGNSITGEFDTFGHNPLNERQKHFLLYIWFDNGKKRAYGSTGDDWFNVTAQVTEAPDKRNVHIIIDGLPPFNDDDSEGSGAGFSPTVDDWIDEENIVNM